jgi:hypothetical protein
MGIQFAVSGFVNVYSFSNGKVGLGKRIHATEQAAKAAARRSNATYLGTTAVKGEGLAR